MERKDSLLLLLALAGAGYATYANWDTIRTKLSLDDLSPGRLKAIDLAKRDMSLDGSQGNAFYLRERQRNCEITMAKDPWDAKRIEGNRFLVVASYNERGQPRSYRFEVDTATGSVTQVQEPARPPR